MDADLLDAFGVDLDGGSAAVAPADSADRAQSPAQNSHVTTEEAAATPEPTPVAAAVAAAENAYIQEQLQKLRAADVPSSPDDMRRMIGEYSGRIEALLIEGQAWSTKELRLSNTVKKLRADNRDLERTAQAARKSLEQAQLRNDDLNSRLQRASQSDRAAADSTRAMKTQIRDAHERRQQLEYELKVAAETRNTLSTALASAEGELTTLRSDLAAVRAQQDSAVRRAQAEARADADQRLAAAAREADSERLRLQAQIDELRQQVLVVEDEAREREVSSLTQLRALRAQLRGAEAQDRAAGGEIQQHTLPLLQQIEDLQARHADQRAEWARKEDAWAARLRDAAKAADLLQAQLDQQAADAAAAAEGAAAEARLVDDLRAEAARLKDQLRAEARIRADMKQQLEDARSATQRLTARVAGLTTEAARGSSGGGSSNGSPPGLGLSGGLSPGHARSPSASSVSSMDSRPRGSSVPDMPAPTAGDSSGAGGHAATKKLGSQITSLKAQLQTALRQKNEYSRSLVDLSVQTDALRAEVAEQGRLRDELDALKHRHETALEMLGEKTEELMDLRADMDDLRAVYKQQLQSLLPGK
ncbi:TATA element modulatory factor 1 [Coemansia helicoidea]|nr:TATA element modulatory factor 1 [Coemansia helicoidea]